MALQTDFYLNQLNIEVNAIQATLHGGENTDPLDGDAVAQLSIPVSYARHLFQYQADALDVNDLNSQDIKFRMFHRTDNSGDINGDTLKMFNTKNILPGESVVNLADRIDFYGDASQSNNEKKVNADFVRYVAEEVFGVPVTDLFNNERPVRVDLNRQAAYEFNTTINSLVNFKVNYGTAETPSLDYVRIVTNNTTAPAETVGNRTKATEFPSRLIFSQLMNHPDGRTRFADLNTYAGADMCHRYTDVANPVSESVEILGNNLWRYMPLAIGDKLHFLLTITPHDDQETVTGGNTNIPARVYKIRLNIVADNDSDITTGSNAPGDYVRAWDNDGWDSSEASSTPLSYLVAGIETGANIVNPQP